jgi:hypothetical protein
MPAAPMEKLDAPLLMNYVFVDFENVHHVEFTIFESKRISLKLLLGARQTKLDTDLVAKLLENPAAIELIRLESSGKNALDFAVAYYLGKAVEADPSGCFHIISKDTGFDPLVAHLRKRKIHAYRHDDFDTLPFCAKEPEKIPTGSSPPLAQPVKQAIPSSKPQDPLAMVLAQLRKNVNNRPKKIKTLLSHIKSHLGKGATEDQSLKLMEKLRKAGHLTIGEKDLVTYRL